jgi:hypothetical protein
MICAVCAVGNIGIATDVFGADHLWWLAGIAGAVVGSVWNYAVSSVFDLEATVAFVPLNKVDSSRFQRLL